MHHVAGPTFELYRASHPPKSFGPTLTQSAGLGQIERLTAPIADRIRHGTPAASAQAAHQRIVVGDLNRSPAQQTFAG